MCLKRIKKKSCPGLLHLEKCLSTSSQYTKIHALSRLNKKVKAEVPLLTGTQWLWGDIFGNTLPSVQYHSSIEFLIDEEPCALYTIWLDSAFQV